MSTAWNARPQPTGGFAPRALGDENPVRTDLKDKLAREYEHRLPEGDGPSRANQRWLLSALGGVSLIAVIVMIYILGDIAGWLAAVLGAAVIAMFFVAGASGYVFGAAERAADAAQTRAEVVKDIEEIEEEGLTETGQKPATRL